MSESLIETEIVSIQAENTLDFLDAAFECYRKGQIFAITRGDIDLGAYGITARGLELTGARRGWGQLEYQADMSDRPAQIVFTSGTEGRPKAIVISHRNLADVVARLNAVMQVSDEIREYIGVPVTYSFGLGRVRAVAAAGGRFYLPHSFDPSEIRRMLVAGEINAISAVPSLWQVVLGAPEAIGEAGAKVRWIEIGSQYMSAADKAAMKRLFPNARIVQHYGLTEASRSTFLDISATDGPALESVGRAQGTVALKITGEGAIAIRGDHVALGQLENGQITPLTQDGWLVTRDRGELRDGDLYYLGRLDDQINVSGIKLAAEALEAEIAALVPGAAGQFAITGIADKMRGEAVLLAIEADVENHGALIAEAAKLALERRGIAAGGVLKRVTLQALPRTGTNKIRRREIAAQYHPEDASATPGTPGATLTAAERHVAKSWAKVIGTDQLAPEQSFFDLGGDSLSSVQIGLVMEAAGFNRASVRATLEGRALADVARLSDEGAAAAPAVGMILPDRTVQSWALSMTRGIMVISVLLSHWGPGLFARLGLESLASTVLNIVYRMGTPGFATVFGMGVGFFMLPDFTAKRVSVLARLRASFLLVLSGLVLLGVIKIGLSVLKGQPIDIPRVSGAFYGVLAYYMIMLGTARWWLPALARLRAPVFSLFFIGLGSWIIWQITDPLITAEQQHSLLEWPRLVLTAGYSLLKLTTVAAAGAGVGYWLARQDDVARAGRGLLMAGLLGSIVAICVILQSYGLTVFSSRGGGGAYVSLPGLLLYLTLAILMLGGFITLARSWATLPGALRLPLKLLIVIGGLALPIYVFHQVVFPARDVLMVLGLREAVALMVPMAGFVAAMGYAGYRLYKMYF